MITNNKTYEYTINMQYVYKEEVINFDDRDIHHLIIDYDYESNNMPIIMTTIRLDKRILNHMIDNQLTNKFIITINKVLSMDENILPIGENYIKNEFNYIIAENKTYTDDVDYNIDNLNQPIDEKKYTSVNIGFVPKQLIERNTRYISGVYKNAKPLDVIYNEANGMNLLVEPFYNNTKYPNIIIPPMESFTQLIGFLNNSYSFYFRNSYRLFYDFNVTYLLNENGSAVESKFEPLDTVVIVLENNENPDGKMRGMSIDKTRQAYVFYTNPEDTDTKTASLPILANKKEVHIDSLGNGNIDVVNPIIVRNTGLVDYSKNTYSRIYVNIVKTELDTSVITMNKKYIIKNYDKLNGTEAEFKLTSKKEVYTRFNSQYQLRLVMCFEKIEKENPNA